MTAPPRGTRFAVARVTLELSTPLTIGTGGGDDTRDATCVEDCNGLPALPATSLVGVLRHALAEGARPEVHPRCRALFGYQDRARPGDDEAPGQSSLVECSWGQVHDASDRPVPIRAATATDEVLDALRAGVLRDHVRIDARGVADGAGKFDEALVPAGARFTFELLVHAGPGVEPRPALEELLGRLAAPGMRLGGRTRRGFGAFRLVRVGLADLDLRKPADRQQWQELPRELALGDPQRALTPFTPRPVGSGGVVARLRLQPADHWIFGGGRPEKELQAQQEREEDRPHDRLPVTERRVRWIEERGQIRGVMDRLEHLVPASGVKGALRHRVAFHARRLAGRWADTAGEGWPDLGALGATDAELWLFGRIKSESAPSEAGRALLSDLYVSSTKYAAMQHVSLDRFTQGPMDGLLFSEALLYQGPTLELELAIETARTGDEPAQARAALAAALRDLCEGRLALGAGSSKGHGFFTGTVEWTDGGRWIGGAA